MLKILTVIGARPQIIKAAALSRAIRNNFASRISEIIVHTGQHYDDDMSRVFFEEMGIPEPDHNLNVGSGSHGKQTAKMIEGIEELLLRENPDCLVLYGDTNSTLAGAVAASKIHVPVVHIEAGLRSFNKSMPEEINRIMCDHVSTLLFSPTKAGLNNLVREGFSSTSVPPHGPDNPAIYHCGDVMYDNSLYFSHVDGSKIDVRSKFGVEKNGYILVTIHRNNNTDEPARLSAIFRAINDISIKNSMDVVLPLHPRTRKLLERNVEAATLERVMKNKKFRITGPASFLEMTALEQHCRIVMTDSGGVQKEAYFFRKPCVILRSETEWIELAEAGTAVIADADEHKIKEAFDALLNRKELEFPPLFGDGKAAEFICSEMLKQIGTGKNKRRRS